VLFLGLCFSSSLKIFKRILVCFCLFFCFGVTGVTSLAVVVVFGVGTDAHTLAANWARVDRVKRSAVERNATILPGQEIYKNVNNNNNSETDTRY
jgi:ABC-type protease/lipase transport system fused ATPase/permease subunit